MGFAVEEMAFRMDAGCDRTTQGEKAMEYHDEAHKELLVAWLNDAYAMEKALIPVLENHAKDLKEYPDVQAKIQQHIEQTRRHADLVENCVEHLGESVSSVKSGFGSLLGQLKSISTGWAKDELIKNALADCGAEYFEVACYTSLIEAARLYGDEEVAQTCREIQEEDREMAQWLEENIPTITEVVMRQKASSKS